MPAFYSPTTGEERFTHYPRGILDGTDDEYEFDDACDDESVASSKIVDLMKLPAGSKHFHHDSDSDSDDDSDGFPNDQDGDEDVDTVIPDETEIVAKKKRGAAVPSGIVVVTKRKETPFELLKRLEEEEESEDEEFNKMLETPIFAKVAKKPSAKCNSESEKENMSPDPIQLKTEIDDDDMDKKPAAKTKEQLEAEKKWKEEEIDNDLIDRHLQKLLDDHFGEVRRPFKMIDLKLTSKDKKVKKQPKKPKKKSRQASKKVDEPPIKKRKLTYQEKQDEAYARSLYIQELLHLTRGKKN